MTPPMTVTAWLRWDAVRRMLPGGRRVLDIGAGTGGFGSFLAERYEYVGVEPDPISFEAASRRIGGRGVLHNCAIEDLEPASDFDLVCAFEVLEHIEDDRAALSLWVRHLRPAGSLLVSVPRGRHRFAAGDEQVGHLRRYDPEDLTRILAGAGLEGIRTTVYGSPWGNLQEAVRGVVFRLRPNRRTMQERTHASGRSFQPPRWGAYVTSAVSFPMRLVQRPFARKNVGTGLVGIGRLPAP